MFTESEEGVKKGNVERGSFSGFKHYMGREGKGVVDHTRVKRAPRQQRQWEGLSKKVKKGRT